jgi:hypothetical protein
LEDSANLPDPDVIAAEIAEDLQAALDQVCIDRNGFEGSERKLKARSLLRQSDWCDFSAARVFIASPARTSRTEIASRFPYKVIAALRARFALQHFTLWSDCFLDGTKV